MSSKDPFLFGLGGDEHSGNTQPRPFPPMSLDGDLPREVTDNPDSTVEAANEFLDKLSGATISEPDEIDLLISKESSTRSGSSETKLPDGAIGAVDGRPFSDFEAAQYKARRLSNQTGDCFAVQALSASQFVVVPPSGGATPEHNQNVRTNSDPAASRSGDEVDDRSYLQIPANQLKLKDFPKGHPVHKCGLARYKKYLKKEFKFKPTYRSMWPLLLLVPFGILTYFYPIRTLNLLPPDIVASIVLQVSAEKLAQGISAFGGILAFVAAGKVLIQRHIRRYMLKPGFANYEEGIVRRKSTKISYSNIVNYDVRQGIIGRLLNYGTLELSSSGSDGYEISMHNVLAPRFVEVVLEGKMEEAKRAASRF